MNLDQDALQKAVHAYNVHAGGKTSSVEVAIETYLEEMFKPGQPARDYRKELWIGVACAIASCENTMDGTAPSYWADQALANFDKTFPKDPS